jgi:hypothetical protein
MEALFLNMSAVAGLFSAIAEAISDDSDNAFYLGAILFLAGPIFFGVTYMRYRNRGARHYHERETPVNMENLQVYDNFASRLLEQRSSTIPGANGQQVNGSLVKDGALESMTGALGSLGSVGSLLSAEVNKQLGNPK